MTSILHIKFATIPCCACISHMHVTCLICLSQNCGKEKKHTQQQQYDNPIGIHSKKKLRVLTKED